MNCKPGDLAIVISAKKIPRLIGIIIKIKEASHFYSGYWLAEDDILENGQPVHFKDTTLRPVSGLPLQEDTDISTHLHTSHTTGTTMKAPA